MPDELDSGAETIQLVPETDVLGIHVPNVEARIGINELDGSVELGISHDGEVDDKELITPDPETPNGKSFAITLGPVTLELGLDADQAAGAVTATGAVFVRDPVLGSRHEVAEVDKTLHYSPAHGTVGKDPKPDPPQVDDPRFGKSRMSSKNVTRFFAEDRKRLIADVGRVVKAALWDDHPDWVFNTVACVGPHDDEGRGSYSDPTSVWFNVFLGYYQIDAPKPDWKRPFGYKHAKGMSSEVDYAEIVRLGKSDWNYFSNWMYGVPDAHTGRFDHVSTDGLRTSQADEGVIGQSSWHRAKIGGVEFVSAYESDQPGAEELVNNSLISFLWRKAFGTPNPRPDFADSFIGASLDADMYISYWEDDEAFHTVIFGGTAPTGADPGFLAAQMDASRNVLERTYPKLGFNPQE